MLHKTIVGKNGETIYLMWPWIQFAKAGHPKVRVLCHLELGIQIETYTGDQRVVGLENWCEKWRVNQEQRPHVALVACLLSEEKLHVSKWDWRGDCFGSLDLFLMKNGFGSPSDA